MSERIYWDFDLIIEPGGAGGYRARVVGSPAGEAGGSFDIPFSALELENFLLKVGRPRRGTRRLESPETEAARQFGAQLFDAVFNDDIRVCFGRSFDAAERKGGGLRIRLRFSDAPELASLPWEYLFDGSTDQFLVLSTWTPIVRYLDLTQEVELLTVDGPLRILVMISSPHDFPSLDVDAEWQLIQGSLAPLVERGVVVVERVEGGQLLDLQGHLRQQHWHIFHYIGHGGYDSTAEDGVLALQDAQGRARMVPGRSLGTILRDHRSLRLAVLNACEGARASDTDPFSGSAQSLVRVGIPAVVAMQFEITDSAAIVFAREFYAAIADGYPVDGAIGEARRAIFGAGNDIEWATPVIYLRGDGRLFDIRPSPPTAAVPLPAEPESPTASTTEETVATPGPREAPEEVLVRAAAEPGGTAQSVVGVASVAEGESPAVEPRDGDGGDGSKPWGRTALVVGLAMAATLAALVFALVDRGDETGVTTVASTSPVTTASPPTTAPPTTAPPTTAPPTTAPPTTAAPTTAAPVTILEPTPPGGFYQVVVPTWDPDPLPGSGGDLGSGCAPGPGPLPDGVWFGFIDESNTSPSTVVFDLACLGSDLFWRNEAETERVVAVHSEAVAWVLDGSGENPELMSYTDWWLDPMQYTDCGLYDLCTWGWLYVNDGLVTEVVPITSDD